MSAHDPSPKTTAERQHFGGQSELEWLRRVVDEDSARLSALRAECGRLRAALEKIAAPVRPDGTYNLSREACEQIAKEALSEPILG